MKPSAQKKIITETKQIYDAVALDFSDTRGKWWRPPIGLPGLLRDGIRALDLGCGNGRFAELFRGKDMEYLGIDNSEELIKICRARFAGEPNIRFEVGDVTNLCKDGACPVFTPDLVLMIAVLHHIPTKELRLRVLKNIHGVLAPGGKLIMRNWNLFNRKSAKMYYKRLLDFPYKISRGFWGIKDAFIPWKSLGKDGWRYVHSFTKNEMKSLLRQAGFTDIDNYYETYNNEKRVSIWQGYNLVSEAKK